MFYISIAIGDSVPIQGGVVLPRQIFYITFTPSKIPGLQADIEYTITCDINSSSASLDDPIIIKAGTDFYNGNGWEGWTFQNIEINHSQSINGQWKLAIKENKFIAGQMEYFSSEPTYYSQIEVTNYDYNRSFSMENCEANPTWPMKK